jgi:hypothetical protein
MSEEIEEDEELTFLDILENETGNNIVGPHYVLSSDIRKAPLEYNDPGSHKALISVMTEKCKKLENEKEKLLQKLESEKLEKQKVNEEISNLKKQLGKYLENKSVDLRQKWYAQVYVIQKRKEISKKMNKLIESEKKNIEELKLKEKQIYEEKINKYNNELNSKVLKINEDSRLEFEHLFI